jgi:2-desacetyl-2-hydroxyethyl bacteriochlorophyllide A dehydrogenase
MRAQHLAFTAPGTAAIVSAEIRALAPAEILIEVEASLVSVGTERSFLAQAPHYPFHPGYSAVGTVLELGSAVKGLAVGDRVFANAEHASHVVCDHRFAFKIPHEVTSEAAAFASIGAMALCATRLAQLKWGDSLLVMGQGLIGLVAVQMGRLQGGLPVLATDVQPRRLELARQLGADAVFDARDETALDQAVAGLPGGGVASIIELCAGADVIDRCIALSRRRGRIVAGSLGHHVSPTNLYGEAWLKALHLLPFYVNARPWRLDQVEVTSPLDWPIRPYDGGEYDGHDTDTTSGDYALFLRMLQHGRIDVTPLLEQQLTPAESAAFFNGLQGSNALGVLIRWR